MKNKVTEARSCPQCSCRLQPGDTKCGHCQLPIEWANLNTALPRSDGIERQTEEQQVVMHLSNLIIAVGALHRGGSLAVTNMVENANEFLAAYRRTHDVENG